MYLGALAVLTCAALVAGLIIGWAPGDEALLVLLLVVLGAGGGAFEIFAPGHYSLQPNFAFMFWGALILPVWGIAAVAVACFLPLLLSRQSPFYKVAFNISNYFLTGIAISLIALAAGGFEDPAALDGTGIAGLIAAASVGALLNHGMIVTAIALAGEQRLRGTLHQLIDGMPLSIGVGLTGGVLALLWEIAPALLIVAAGPLGLVYRALWVPMLRHQANTDSKTGLYNFEHFRAEFDHILRDAQRRERELSVVMVDLDHLRAINTRAGHLAGDRAIRAVADELAAAAAEHGIAGRFGGEEFCLLLPGFSASAAHGLMLQVRDRVAAVEFRETDDPEMRVTFSAGVSSFPEHGDSAQELLVVADTALYEAKAAGRDRVRVALSSTARSALHQSNPPDVRPAAAMVASTAVAPRSTMAKPAPARVPQPPQTPGVPDQTTLNAAASKPAHTSNDRLLSRYAMALVLAASVAGLAGGTERIADRPWLFGVLALSVILLDFVRIDMFGRGHISPGAVPSIVLAWTCGPLGVLGAEAGVAVLRLLRRDPLTRVAIDFGHLTLTGTLLVGLFGLVVAGSSVTIVLVGTAAGIVYYAANALCLTTIWALTERTPAIQAWRERFAWAAPHYAFYGALAGAFMVTDTKVGLAAAVLLVGLPIGALWLSQKQYLDRSRAGVDDMRRANADLEQANRRLMSLLEDNQDLLTRMQHSYLSTITSLARTIEAKDPYTGDHTERVARIASMIASELEFDAAELRAVEMGAVLHDIGKIGVADSVLLKDGVLDPGEQEQMRKHPEIASYIVADLELPAIVKQMVRSHHERFDGAGYPDGLTGEEIPLAARILAVADALDAMLSDRPYRKALPVAAARQEIVAGVGTQFCPRVVDALTRCLAREPGRGGDMADELRGSRTSV